MFAAQTDQQLAGGHVLTGAGLDGVDHLLGAGGMRGQGRQGMDAVFEGVFAVELAVVQLDLARGVDDGARAATGTLAEADGRLVGDRQHDDLGLFVAGNIAFEPQKVLRRGVFVVTHVLLNNNKDVNSRIVPRTHGALGVIQ